MSRTPPLPVTVSQSNGRVRPESPPHTPHKIRVYPCFYTLSISRSFSSTEGTVVRFHTGISDSLVPCLVTRDMSFRPKRPRCPRLRIRGLISDESPRNVYVPRDESLPPSSSRSRHGDRVVVKQRERLTGGTRRSPLTPFPLLSPVHLPDLRVPRFRTCHPTSYVYVGFSTMELNPFQSPSKGQE